MEPSCANTEISASKRKRNLAKNLVHPNVIQVGLGLGVGGLVPSGNNAIDQRSISMSSNLKSTTNRHQTVKQVNHVSGKTLDGFMMLEFCHIEFPEEIAQAVLSGAHINSVIEEDMLFFTNLKRLDLSDNEAPFEPFGCLPQLVELDMQCNALEQIIVGNGFQTLEVLNLSFNCLTIKDVEELSNLLRIRELYLGNNWIRGLPPIMDRFSKLETLSLEHNRIKGDEIFNLLLMVPKLRHLNLSHNKITSFPESALILEDKRGAGFYNLTYLNLAHNQITREEDVIFTSELHSLRKLVLYGNPLAHAAVSSQDGTKLNYDPIPRLHACIAEHTKSRDVVTVVVVAYPDTKKKKSSGTSSAYENVEIYKILPNEIPLPSPFRSRATTFLLSDEAEVARKTKEQQVNQTNKPRIKNVQIDTSDTTFLTGVGIEDVLTNPAAMDLLTEVPSVPSSMVTRTLADMKLGDNVMNTRTALNALRYQLEHPLTSHDDSELSSLSSLKPTFSQMQRQRKRHTHESQHVKSEKAKVHRDNGFHTSRSPTHKQFTTSPSPFKRLEGSRAVDDALTQLSYQVGRTWGDHSQQPKPSSTGTCHAVDTALNSLVSTAHKVSLAYR